MDDAGMSTTLERAARLASAQPDRPVPCPVCAAEVKGANLERHLAKVHGGAGAGPHAHTWRGPERVGARSLLVLSLLCVVGAAAFSAVVRPEDGVILAAAAALGVGLLVWGAVQAGAPLFPGRLRVDERGVLLTHSFGLGRRRLGAVERVVVGSAWEIRSTSLSNTGESTSHAGRPVRIGSYLQLRQGGRRITVHCRSSGSLRSVWSGFEQGTKRRRLDITLSAPDFTALQYALWELGALAPRT